MLLRQDVQVSGAGRTDAGVHAAMMVAHFDIQAPLQAPLPAPPVKAPLPAPPVGGRAASPVASCSQEDKESSPPRGELERGLERGLDLDNLVYRLNGVLPHDIAVHKIYPVADDLHARFSARARTYYYYVHTRKSPFLRDRSWRLVRTPDFAAMNSAAATLMDYEDFTSFSKVNTDTKTNICHVTAARWVQLSDFEWRFEITADRFLRNMVRAIVGTLMEVGRGSLSVDGFRRVIEQKNRSAAGDSVPARGLFLQNVEYDLNNTSIV